TRPPRGAGGAPRDVGAAPRRRRRAGSARCRGLRAGGRVARPDGDRLLRRAARGDGARRRARALGARARRAELDGPRRMRTVVTPSKPACTPIVALDVPSAKAALDMVATLGDAAGFYKVGLELFTRAGPSFVEELLSRRKRVFLD